MCANESDSDIIKGDESEILKDQFGIKRQIDIKREIS